TRIPSIDDVIDRLPDRFSARGAQIVNERIASIVVDWHISTLETPSDPTLGQDPVLVFNQLCAEFGLDFNLPAWISLRRPYTALLFNADGDPVQWNELSSGEQVIFRIICWLFYYRTKNNFYPKVLLLDEPDAHLTPRMIRRFLHSLRETVHEKLGIAVIMTTHSPNTVALVDENSLYRLSRSPGGTRDLAKVSRQQAVAELSEGLLFVQEETRLVFVEGKTDVPFYQRIYQSMASTFDIESIPSLKFFAASHGQEDRGGVTKVREVVARFSETQLERLVCGICDGDTGNEPQKNLWVVNRYSIENYIYDPFLVACHLLIAGKQALLQSLNGLQTGSWATLVENAHLRQSAVSEICDEWATLLPPEVVGTEMAEHREVRWRVGSDSQPVAYSIPEWVTRMRGKDLTRLGVHNTASSLKNVVTLEGQYVAMETLRAVPEDIHRILLSIQRSASDTTNQEE
ncbi:MAG: AAA family ATPase, partial [Quadrisphaera sp.]